MLEWLRARQASEVQVWIRKINEEVLRFFLKRGFVEYRRTARLLLSVPEVDLASFEPFVERVKAQGIQIVSLEEEVGRGVDALRTWHDMVQADESPAMTYVEFLERGVLRWMVPGSCFFARLEDQYVGYSSLLLPYVYPGDEADPGLLEQGYVRVRPPFRNRGIATALGVHLLGFAKRRNYLTIRADVAVTNAPSLAVKAKLGYRPAGGEIWVRKSPV
jgi:GNAT superfamily N-acetyltransferase